jgi:hypothetical protein
LIPRKGEVVTDVADGATEISTSDIGAKTKWVVSIQIEIFLYLMIKD